MQQNLFDSAYIILSSDSREFALELASRATYILFVIYVHFDMLGLFHSICQCTSQLKSVIVNIYTFPHMMDNGHGNHKREKQETDRQKLIFELVEINKRGIDYNT